VRLFCIFLSYSLTRLSLLAGEQINQSQKHLVAAQVAAGFYKHYFFELKFLLEKVL